MTRAASGRRVVVGGMFALAAIVALPGTADAHALLSTSDPLDGTKLDEAPKEVRASFTEPPELQLSDLTVLDPSGAEVDSGRTELVAGDPSSLRVDLDDLDRGVYTVTWRVVSEVDGHLTGGAFAFGVGEEPTAGALDDVVVPESPVASPVEMTGRWVLFVGFSLLLGASWIGLLAFPDPPAGVRRLALGGALVAVAGVVTLGVAQRGFAGVTYGEFFGTSIGRAVLWRGVATAVALAAAFLAAFAPANATRRASLAMAGVASGVVILVHVMSGHAASPGSLGALAIASQWAHFAAVGVWIGGLAAVLVGVRGREDEVKARAVRRFSFVAGIALAVVAATGVLLAVDEVGSFGALLSSGYGRIVLIKTALLLTLAGLGALNRYRNVPAALRSLRGLRRAGGAELGIAAVTLVAAAAMATLVPPQLVPEETRAPAALVASGQDFATTVRVRLEVDPAVPGPNTFALFVEDFDTAEPLEAQNVTLRFDHSAGLDLPETRLELEAVEEGEYAGSGTNLLLGGVWEVTALVQTETDAVEVPLEVGTLCETIDIPAKGAKPEIHVVETPGVGSAEGYVLALGGDSYDVHFTFVDESGRELQVDALTVMVTGGDGTTEPLQRLLRLSKGHFAAGARLEDGRWRFDGFAELADGQISGCFEEEIPT